MPNPSGYHQHRPSSTQRHQCFALGWPSLQRLLHLVCPLLLLLLLLIGGGERWKRRTIIIGLDAVIGATGTSATPTTKQTATGSNGNGGRLQPIILDESRCPLGWTGAGQQCVQLQFLASRPAQAESECRRMGAQLANVLDADGEPDAPTLEDLADILEEALMAGLPADQSAGWLVSPGPFLPEWDPSSERVRFRLLPKGVEVDRPALGLRMRRGGQQQQEGTSSAELLLLSNSSAQPFVCALSPLWRRMRLYEQQLLPRGGPRLEEQPEASYFFDPSASRTSTAATAAADKNNKKYKNIANESSSATSGGGSYLSLPCSASGNPTPSVRWFRNGGDEVELNSTSSHFVVSTGALLVPLWLLPASPPATFHCVATNRWGSVRSRTATIRPAFIEPFRESRLDAFPLISGASKGGGARLECQAPRHFPRSFSFSWVRGDSYEKFVEVSPRIFISMDGTLYFAYNVREDEDSYACTLTSAATQSAQHGPFFRLLLPLGHINPKLLPRLSSGGGGGGKPAAAKLHPHAFAPRIDEFQPQLFPSEVPARGQTAYLECFAYGFPVPTYRWTRVDGQPLPSGRHKLLSFGRILRIDSLELADSGRYRCSVQNELGTASAELRLSVQAPPSLFRPLIDRLASPGSSASFQCHLAAESSGAVQVEWFRDGVPLAPLLLPDQDRDRFKLGGNELTILDLRQSDSAIYQCLASNDVGSVSSSALLLVSALPPRFHANVMPARLFVVEGSPLSMPCLFQSSPPAKARWMRLGEDGENGGERHAQLAPMLLDQSVPGAEIALLSLDSAQLMDSGVYECTAQNGLGTAKAIVRLEVLARPQMSIRTGEEDAASATRKFTCELEINCRSAEECPEALFSWEFNDRPIRSLASANKARENGRRLFRLRQREQQHLKRRGPREGSAELLLVSQQQSQLELPAQFTNEHVGRFACNSLFGGATAELESQLAFVPLKLSVQQVDESGGARLVYRTVELLGSAANGAEKIKRRGFGADEAKAQQQQRIYELEARTGAERRWRPIRRVELAAAAVGSGGGNNNNGWPGEIQLDGLEPNQRYQFRLRPAGDRVQAVSLSDWIHTPQTVPSQPVRDLRFRMLDDRHVLLEWEPVERAHQSAPDLRYNVSWTLPGGRGAFAELVDSPRLVIPLPEKQGPEECLVLEVGVRPVNRKGPGLVATEMVVRASGKEPQRFADGRLQTVNATHLNLSWHWEGEDPCENVVGAKIMCVEEAIDRLRHMREAGQSMEEEGEEADRQRRPNWTTNSSISGNGTTVSSEVTQSVPADYGQWLVHSLLPQREYVCRVVAFDQYGRTGPMRAEANARAWTAERAPERAPEISFVLVKESADTASGGYAVLLDWRAVALAANDSAADSSTTTMEKARLRGYKLFVYVSETAEQPIVLTLTEAELHDPLRPSARIDGLKPMFFYGIQVAAFNPGGLGPLSERIPVRVGAHQQLNPGLVRHQHSSSSVENGSRRMASADGLGLPALLLILLISLAFSLHPTEIPFSPTVKRSSRTSSQTTSTLAVHSPQDHQRRQCPHSSPAALSQLSYSSTSSPNGFTLFFPFSSSFLSTTFASKTFHSKSRHT